METKVGELASPDHKRDAIHVPVVPMRAVGVLQPGQRLRDGVVDPFLREPVQPGQWFYLFLFPGTVTSLRHVWTHPGFPDEAAAVPVARRCERDVWAAVPNEVPRAFDLLPNPESV